jgi:hypothetical protein
MRTIERYKPTIMIELSGPALNACGSSATAVKAQLFSTGYKGWIIRGTSLVPIQPNH